jgi:hypothetical protein
LESLSVLGIGGIFENLSVGQKADAIDIRLQFLGMTFSLSHWQFETDDTACA